VIRRFVNATSHDTTAVATSPWWRANPLPALLTFVFRSMEDERAIVPQLHSCSNRQRCTAIVPLAGTPVSASSMATYPPCSARRLTETVRSCQWSLRIKSGKEGPVAQPCREGSSDALHHRRFQPGCLGASESPQAPPLAHPYIVTRTRSSEPSLHFNRLIAPGP
jgi:hypothetical protein